MPRKIRKSAAYVFTSTVLRLMIWTCIAILTAVAVDRIGPYRGWIAHMLESALEEVDGVDSEAEDQESRGGVEDELSGLSREFSAPDKTQLELTYERLKKSHMENLAKPVIGREYAFHIDNGKVLRGELLERSASHIEVAVKEGRIEIPYLSLSPADQTRFFPEQAARRLALQEVRKTITAGEETSQPPRIRPGDANEAEDDVWPSELSSDRDRNANRGGRVAGGGGEAVGKGMEPAIYPVETDASLRPLLEKFGEWMNYQNRRAGHKIAVTAYAKRQGKACVLYLVLSDSFKAQDYDLRFHLAEALWQFWAFRSERLEAVQDPDNAYVILLDRDDQILGGSRPTEGSQIFIRD